MTIMMDETLIRGDVNELHCILDFQNRGYYCSIPFSGSCRYDVVVDINGKLLKIQCKAASYHIEDGTLRMHTTRSTTNTLSTTRYSYSKDEIDYFYTSWNSYGFLIPVEETSTMKWLRIKKPEHVQESMSIAADYLIDNVIESIKMGKPILKYKDNRIISIDDNGKEHLWTTEELNRSYGERQIRYIKENIMKHQKAYNLSWKYKEFPEL